LFRYEYAKRPMMARRIMMTMVRSPEPVDAMEELCSRMMDEYVGFAVCRRTGENVGFILQEKAYRDLPVTPNPFIFKHPISTHGSPPHR
jgi:hypothetical protein